MVVSFDRDPCIKRLAPLTARFMDLSGSDTTEPQLVACLTRCFRRAMIRCPFISTVCFRLHLQSTFCLIGGQMRTFVPGLWSSRRRHFEVDVHPPRRNIFTETCLVSPAACLSNRHSALMTSCVQLRILQWSKHCVVQDCARTSRC